MSCYFRHLSDIMAEAGIEVTPQNRKKIDEAIHHIMNVDYKQCPAAWKALKEQILNNEPKRRDFVKKLKQAVT